MAYDMRISDWSSYVCSSDLYDPPQAGPDGIDDPLRCDYLRTHIAAIGDAIKKGVDVRCYLVWSLLDNLELSPGYSKRFSIVHVDYATQVTSPEHSPPFYAKLNKNNGKRIG